MKNKLIIFCLLSLVSLSGCAFVGGFNAEVANQGLMKLNIGDSTDQVLKIMGRPDHIEKFQSGGQICDVWHYRTKWDSDKETDDQFTPVVFIDAKLVGWGRKYYDNSFKVKIEVNK